MLVSIVIGIVVGVVSIFGLTAMWVPGADLIGALIGLAAGFIHYRMSSAKRQAS